MKTKTFFVLMGLIIVSLRVSAQVNCGTEQLDSATIVNQPWFGNNQYLEDFMTGPDYSGNGEPCPSCRVTTARYRVPVRAWILRRNDGTFNNANPIRTDEIEEIIRETNNLFLNTNAGIQFYLSCEITFVNNTNFYENIENTSESDDMFSAIGEAGYVDVMFIHDNSGNWSGRAKYPTTSVAARRFKCAVTTFNGATKYTNLEIASALAHELGHVFGLQHTHSPGRAWWQTQNADNGLCYQESVDHLRRQSENGGFCALTWLTGNPYKCEVNGDQLCDTEADPNVFSQSTRNVTQPPGCAYSYGGSLNKYIVDNWGDAWTPPTRNIMSYSRAACIIEFSRMQVASMNYYILQFFNQNTFVYVDPDFDIFEPDNQALSAQRIAINSDQLHTFHWQPDINASGQAEACDADWVIFAITTTNNYVIQTKAVVGEPTPDTQISLFQDVSGTLTLVQTNNDISTTNKFSRIMRSLNPGTYFLQVTQSEAYPATGSRGHYYIQVSDDCYTFLNTTYSISGPGAVCSTNATFTLSNVPTGATIAWDKSSNITYVSGGGNTPSYTVTKGSNGSGFITAVVNSANCGSVQVQKNVQVGPTTANFSISAYPDCGSPGEYFDFTAEIQNVNYSWTVNGGTLRGGQGTRFIWAQMTSSSMAVHCYVTGTSAANCFSPQGISSRYISQCYGFNSLTASPNPASNSLTIELDEPEENKPVGIELRNNFGKAVKSFIAYNNRFEINTESLPEGLYILKVSYDGQIFNRRILIEK